MAGPISGYDPVTGRGLTYEELYAKNKAEAQPVFQGAFGTSSTGYTPGAGGSGQGIGLFGGGGFPNGGGFGNEDLQALYDAGPGYIPWDNPNAPRAMGGSGVPNYLAGLTGSGNMNPYNAGWNPMGNEGNAYGRRYLGAGQQVTAPPMGPDAAAALAARLSAPARTPATPVAGGATPPATGSTPSGNTMPSQAGGVGGGSLSYGGAGGGSAPQYQSQVFGGGGGGGAMGSYGGAPTTYGGFQMGGGSYPQYQTGPMGGYGGSWQQPNQTNPMRTPRSQNDQLTTRTGGQARMTY